MRALALEAAKLRRKHVSLVVLAMVGAVLAWLYLDAHQEGQGSATGWWSLLYAAPIMNSVFLSLLASVVASRIADVDHEAHAWKQLLCLQRTGSVLVAKLVLATLLMALAVALEVAGMGAMGTLMHFPHVPAVATWVSFVLLQLVSCLGIVTVVLAVALWWENQFVSLAVGLALALVGLFASLLPQEVARLVPSGYFTLLSRVVVDWGAGTGAPVFSEVPVPWGDCTLLLAFVVVVATGSFVGFSRKEH